MAVPSGALATRAVVGAVLAAIAVAAVAAGGFAFTALVTAACLLMSAEWTVMQGLGRGFRLASLATLAVVAALTVGRGAGEAAIVLAAAAGLLGLLVLRHGRGRALWGAAGVLYVGPPMIALVWLRAQPGGELTIAVVFATVWATDIGAFFAGRAVGGPKLAPAISPNKTWAGVVGGIAAAVAVVLALAWFLPDLVRPDPRLHDTAYFVRAVAWAGVLSLLAVAGDLFESWLKRRAGVKDSGTLLPGHGGVMDRLDGLVPVAVAAALAVAAGL